MRRCVVLAAVALTAAHSLIASAATQEARLLRRPTVSRDAVAFAYASDLWIVGRDGGRARRLTSTADVETDPRFSPDGSWIAFTATVSGNTDVYVVSAAGGTPRRLTHHPGLDLARGWTRDGQRVIFGSGRGVLPTPHVSSYVRLWTVGLEGGMPQMLPMPRAYTGTFSPDAQKFAYEEFTTECETLEGQLQSAQWRHYRGGRTHPIRVMNLADHSEHTLPWRDSNDSDPMWIGDTIFFVSDRNFTANLFAYPTGGGTPQQLTHHDDYDVMNASAGPDAIVYEQAGFIHLLDARSGRSTRLRIEVEGAFPWAQAQTKDVGGSIRNAAASPSGTQIAFEAHGEIFIRAATSQASLNLTRSAAANDRNPAWSADGKQLAWLSDASGEYQLFIADPSRRERPRAIELPAKGYFSTPAWSPDGRHIALRHDQLTLWTIELATGRATRVDADTYDDPARRIEPVWSADSRTIAYSKNLPNHLHAIFLYSLAERKARQLTDSGVDAISPSFDRDGKSLYFLASTDFKMNTATWLQMSSLERPVTRTIHQALLGTSGASPRIVALDIPAGDYFDLIAGPAGTFFYAEHEKSALQRWLSPASASLLRYRVRTGERATFLTGVDRHAVSVQANQVLYRKAGDSKWSLAAMDRTSGAGDAEIDSDGLDMRIDPRVEWPHIFREAWRVQRDYFYQAKMHGADWPAVYEKYAPLVGHVNHRADLGYLIATVGGELSVGHSSLTKTDDVAGQKFERVGMLGADYTVANGRFRIQRIYTADPWNPASRAPLDAPGVDVKQGDYLLEVNGKPLLPAMEIYALFEGTAGKPTQLRVSSTAEMADSRVVTVTPIADEEPLRTQEDWVEKNRRRVAELSGGRIGYVWLPNTWVHGYQAFNRYFYGQLDKEGFIVDVRYNQGGLIPDYIVDALARPQFGNIAMRDGAVSTLPIDAIHGPKIMLINESAGSGGDALPYQFKHLKAGTLVGTRTWGGLVGPTTASPAALDGGGITAPNAAFYDVLGRWSVENEGVAPDIEVRNAPAAVIAGRDPQLERAVDEAMKQLRSNPLRRAPKPAPPDRVSPPSSPSP